MDGFIKIYRKIKDWQHFQEPSVLLVWIDLLVSANFKRGYFQGISVPKGSLITSYRKLSEETGLSVNTIKVCISKLVCSGEIAVKSAKGQFTQITINQYDKYQGVSMVDTPTDTLTDTPTDTPTDTLTDYNRRKKRRIRKKEDNMDVAFATDQPNLEPAKKSLEERQKDFYNEIAEYLHKYDREMLRAFYDYWSEPNQKNTKMRKELERTWSTGGRLATWNRRQLTNNQQFNSSNNGKQERRKLTDEEIIGAVTEGLGLHFAKRQNHQNN